MAAHLGVRVTIVELLDDILPGLDADVRREARRSMEGQLGVTILTGNPLEGIRAGTAGVAGEVNGQTVSAEMMLLAVGRIPTTAGLVLEKAGLEDDAVGSHRDRSRLRDQGAGNLRHRRCDRRQHASWRTPPLRRASRRRENACGGARLPAETLVPACIFTDPEIGAVGLTEQQAKGQGRAVRTGKFFFAALGRALASGREQRIRQVGRRRRD